MVLLKYKCIGFDLDATVYFGNQLVNQTNIAIDRARKISDDIFLLQTIQLRPGNLYGQMSKYEG